MTKENQNTFRASGFLFLLAFAMSCSILQSPQEEGSIASGGMKLWEQNCVRCHNIPSPAAFNDDEWEIIGAHMRVRAYLSEKEKDEIIKFLKTIN